MFKTHGKSISISADLLTCVKLLVTEWDCTYFLTVVLLLQGCVQSSRVDAEVSWGAQLHVLHQINLEKHAHRRWCNTVYEGPIWCHSFLRFAQCSVFTFKYVCISENDILSTVLSNPVHTYLWFLWECDEVFLILLNAEDQVRDGLCLTQKFWL